MKRALLILAVLPALAGSPVWTVQNDFARQHDRWVSLRNARETDPVQVGTLSAAEVLEWRKLKSAWRQLEKQVDAEYRGE